jgi:two-component system sensor histidine kinase GlrK
MHIVQTGLLSLIARLLKHFREIAKNMRTSIFFRLIIGYLMLFSILAGVSLYFIYHLDQFNKVIRSIIANDTIALEYSNQLSDALLSASRHDRKFAVLKDEKLFESSLEAGVEFTQLLNEAVTKTNSSEIKQYFYAIGSEHQNFMRLVTRERELLKSNEAYSPDWYAGEKKKIAETIIDQLKKIRQASEKNARDKIVFLNQTGERAKNVAVLLSVFALSAGLLVAFAITRSVKKPLDVMRAKTLEIARGKFEGDLNITSPPEIAELASALNIMCQKLKKVDDIKTDFFSHMSHELRTPLTSIKVGTDMLLEGLGGELSKKQQHILSIITKESDRLIELVNSLLDLTKMEAGMLKYNFMPTDLSMLVKKSLDALTPLVAAKNISIDNRIDELQPVHVDRERILQVLGNIIGNAVKFNHDHGTIKLEAHLRENFIEVAVHDTGPGIPQGDLERIFIKFHQGISTEGTRVKGTGIGLATVKQVILAHGGKAWATSQVGQGSTLHITLPLAV